MVKHARYDQFLESDYDRLTRDVNNAVIDDNTQQPPHLRPTRYPCHAAYACVTCLSVSEAVLDCIQYTQINAPNP